MSCWEEGITTGEKDSPLLYAPLGCLCLILCEICTSYFVKTCILYSVKPCASSFVVDLHLLEVYVYLTFTESPLAPLVLSPNPQVTRGFYPYYP